MTPTNRPITSREYKLMLNTERFRDRRAGAGLFWKLLTFLVENQGNEVISDQVDPRKGRREDPHDLVSRHARLRAAARQHHLARARGTRRQEPLQGDAEVPRARPLHRGRLRRALHPGGRRTTI